MGKNGVKPRDDELWPPTVFEPFAEWLESPSTSRSGRKRQREPLTGAKLREAPPDGHWPKMARTPDEQLGRERWWKERSHVGIQPKGLALAITTGACLAAGYSLLSDHDVQRTKKSVAGGSLFFLGSYLFIRGTRFDDAQTGAVVTACFTLAAIIAYARANPR
ncbi:hypothetical protein EMIHUDRAFT_236474 [Emiliania huxleyi CCMP1516]|uniref:Uncharacterized protein n=2 Tax=Emiliania huxleyi TaxID=2903 RepID=A0A0D3JTG3_EMIH1|nr:hypothetical protein EMIHUDRAFT_236474 [Emiliania huxleyi CCMP1516]EOD26798.1 hypothetical protein EMIHUDRAFT_236474 [Emiliania huxleyi CCMP1516]|eukprot:XP_005779227.1 hypothetical protein EMIHUDRAFT_236474 [Emiliania huxleyi CCMP1516]